MLMYDFVMMSWRVVGVLVPGLQWTGCGLGECGMGLFLVFHILNILLFDDKVEDILILLTVGSPIHETKFRITFVSYYYLDT